MITLLSDRQTVFSSTANDPDVAIGRTTFCRTEIRLSQLTHFLAQTSSGKTPAGLVLKLLSSARRSDGGDTTVRLPRICECGVRLLHNLNLDVVFRVSVEVRWAFADYQVKMRWV